MKNVIKNHSRNFGVSKNEVMPREVFLNSDKKYWFNCDKCSHDFIIKITNVNSGYWCQYCASQKLCSNNNSRQCYEKYFVKFWSNKNEISPRQVFKESSNYWFNCGKCNHNFKMRISNITYDNYWCNYCVNQKFCNDNNCKECYEKSFAKFWRVLKIIYKIFI